MCRDHGRLRTSADSPFVLGLMQALLLYSLALAENSHDIRALQNLLFLYVQQGFTEQAAVLERQLTALRRGDVHPPTPSWPKTRFALVTVGMPDNNKCVPVRCTFVSLLALR
jgi:hypothetical protein